MHVHELNPIRTTVILIGFTILIIIGLLTINNPRLTYKLSPKNTASLVGGNENYFYPYQLENLINGKDKNTLLFDIRNNFVFGQGHIPGAENVDAIELINEDNIKRLESLKKKGITVVVYGDTQLQANGPWMLLRQLGFDNIKILPGGFEYYNLMKNDLAASKTDLSYLPGNPKFNYAEISTSSGSDTLPRQTTKTEVKVERKKKNSGAEGGC